MVEGMEEDTAVEEGMEAADMEEEGMEEAVVATVAADMEVVDMKEVAAAEVMEMAGQDPEVEAAEETTVDTSEVKTILEMKNTERRDRSSICRSSISLP